MSPSRHWVRLHVPAAVAILLAATSPAVAQTAVSRSPARRTPSASLAASVPLPPPPPGMSRTAPRPAPFTSRDWRIEATVGTAIGIGKASLGAAPEVRLDAYTPLPGLARGLGLEAGASVSFASWFPSTSRAVPALGSVSGSGLPGYPYGLPGLPGWPGVPVAGSPTDTITRSAVAVAIVPSARLLVPLAPALTLYTSGGLGLAEVLASTTEDRIFFGKQETRGLATALLLRLGVGLSYAVTEQLRLTAEPVGLDLHVGSDASAFSVLVGASYRL